MCSNVEIKINIHIDFILNKELWIIYICTSFVNCWICKPENILKNWNLKQMKSNINLAPNSIAHAGACIMLNNNSTHQWTAYNALRKPTRLYNPKKTNTGLWINNSGHVSVCNAKNCSPKSCASYAHTICWWTKQISIIRWHLLQSVLLGNIMCMFNIRDIFYWLSDTTALCSKVKRSDIGKE